MKDNVKDLTRKIARLSAHDLRELEGALLNNGISATLYRFSPTQSMWDGNNEYDIVITNAGRTKLMLVKTIKETFGWGLKESKELVDSAPCVVQRVLGVEEANVLKETLENAGATIEIRES